MKLLKLVIASATVALLANGAAQADAPAREAVMKEIGAAMGGLGRIAKGEVAYDAAAAEAAKAALIAAAAAVPEAFKEEGPADAASESKAEIWTNWEDFVKQADALTAAATAADVSSAEAIGASMAALGGTCKDCHTAYRVMK
ncbi:cytochrome c [Xinfangfangia sp. CPCC 101601]|uniref:Cytochrome c n=1 Tax=Pseudogemmobacter lacusdianii TaxID=3069608 RepID=A0ABU0VXN0_9RHOB|nr:cytochrome c [Xinfangfangia sp. CPCC 101601]MDQ2066517.1 cytochrome c [Xinfangfangia sp. CPCC 101601]